MNHYQYVWDVLGYGKRYRKVIACQASEGRKSQALARIWARMVAK